ncbi:MAG: ATPase, partial [Epsilonproteobacteria bacterium]|nr:ATPase [Campylobacterota bacterium]
KKSELVKLKENCQIAGIKPDYLMLFTKKGYTSELKSLKNDTLQLLTNRNLKVLL